MEYPRDKLLQKDVVFTHGESPGKFIVDQGLIFHTTSMLVYARVADPAKSGRYNKQCIWHGDLSCIVARLLGCYHHFWGCMQPEKLRLWPMNLSTCNWKTVWWVETPATRGVSASTTDRFLSRQPHFEFPRIGVSSLDSFFAKAKEGNWLASIVKMHQRTIAIWLFGSQNSPLPWRFERFESPKFYTCNSGRILRLWPTLAQSYMDTN